MIYYKYTVFSLLFIAHWLSLAPRWTSASSGHFLFHFHACLLGAIRGLAVEIAARRLSLMGCFDATGSWWADFVIGLLKWVPHGVIRHVLGRDGSYLCYLLVILLHAWVLQLRSVIQHNWSSSVKISVFILEVGKATVISRISSDLIVFRRIDRPVVWH